MVSRRTLDGWQPVAAFSWLVNSKRASKAEVYRLMLRLARHETPNVRGNAGQTACTEDADADE
jgi:hypothetical protein